VLTVGMSMPLSMIVVHTSTSKRPSQKSTTTCSRLPSSIWPWAIGDAGLGHELAQSGGALLDRW
jgi:hypothetical protein